jgi:hypothetical protein
LVSRRVGVARVVTHDILHSFLPGRPDDTEGVFMERLGRDTLLRREVESVPIPGGCSGKTAGAQ